MYWGDTIPPVANAGPDQTVDEDTPVNLDGSGSTDNVEITSYTWTFIDVTPQTLTGVNPIYTFKMPGEYTITLNVTDTAGNWDTDTVLITVLDVTSPTISVLSPENKTYAVADVPLTLTVSEPTSWIGYSLDGQANVTITGNTTLAGLLDGVHYVVVYANDTAGNMGASSTVYFTVDTTPPNITVVSQTPLKNNVLPEDEVKVNATVTDELSGVKQVTLNYTNGNGTWVIIEMTSLSVHANVWSAIIPAFPFGTNVTFVVIAEDNANNTITTEDLGYEYQYSVIPEFPSFLILPLFMIATLLIVIVYRRKLACMHASLP